MGIQIFRVTVRGRFDRLDDQARASLLAAAGDHEPLDARFTPDGTLTYDRRIDFFSFRVEVRVQPDDRLSADEVTQSAVEQGMARAAVTLDRRSIGYRSLTAKATNMASMWS